MWLALYFYCISLFNLFKMRPTFLWSALKQDTISSAKGMESLKWG